MNIAGMLMATEARMQLLEIMLNLTDDAAYEKDDAVTDLLKLIPLVDDMYNIARGDGSEN